MRIMCVGDINADLVVPYGKVLNRKKGDGVAKVTFKSGGTVSNTTLKLGMLGCNPIFITELCDDNIGNELKEDLIEKKVDLSYSITSDNKTMICIAVVDDKGERVILPWFPKGSRLMKFNDDMFKDIPLDDYIIFSSGMVLNNDEETMNALVKFLKKMKANTNSKIVFDLNIRSESYGMSDIRRKYFEEVIKISDILLGTYQDEIEYFTNSSDKIEGCLKLSKNKVIICHDGSNPVLVFENNQYESLEVVDVKPNHTIGAGDIFNAGVLYGLYQGLDIIEASKKGIIISREYLENDCK